VPSHGGQLLVTEHLKTSPIPSVATTDYFHRLWFKQSTSALSQKSLLRPRSTTFSAFQRKGNPTQNKDVPRIIRLEFYKKPLDHQIPRYPICLDTAWDLCFFDSIWYLKKRKKEKKEKKPWDVTTSLIATFSLLYSRPATIVKILSGLLFLSKNRISYYLKYLFKGVASMAGRQTADSLVTSDGVIRSCRPCLGRKFSGHWSTLAERWLPSWILVLFGGEQWGRCLERDFGENTFCMDCEDSNSRGTGGEQPQYFFSAIDALKSVINVLKTASITVVANQIVLQICSSGRFIFPWHIWGRSSLMTPFLRTVN